MATNYSLPAIQLVVFVKTSETVNPLVRNIINCTGTGRPNIRLDQQSEGNVGPQIAVF